MICLVCKSHMLTRSGKHGEFYYCPHGKHGTISVAKYNTIVASLSKDGLPISGADQLTQDIERKQAILGLGSMTDIERFYIDSPAYDEDNFWQDIRPDG